MAPGERALGKETFGEDIGDFWAISETRPYMRAPLGLAQCLYAVGRTEEGAAHYREMLRLNPNDNHDVRDLLAVCPWKPAKMRNCSRFWLDTKKTNPPCGCTLGRC